MTENASGAQLTTSRINRLLRPLRNKCNTLAALTKSVTASSRVKQSNWDPNSTRPPLAVLRPPAGTKNLTPDKSSADEFEFSRRTYSVCDAFKNIAYVAYGHLDTPRVPSLAVMCTLVVGGNMPAEDFDTADLSEDSMDEDDQLDVDGIYEAVPPHYRRFLVVSHALSMILAICSHHHHTLVTILLDHCLSFGLVHESTRLLNMVLAQAFLPSHPSYSPPVTHPAHANYLVDLHAKWAAGNKPPGASSGPLLFATSTFCQAVLGFLSQSSSCSSHILWTSKVMNKLFHVVKSCDIDSYILITHTLSQHLLGTADTSSYATPVDSQPAVLRNKLSELMSTLFDLLFTQCDSHSVPQPQCRIYAIVDILCDCHAAQLHSLRTSAPGSPIDLPDVIILFATHIFVVFRKSIDYSDRVLAILDDCGPVPTTFSKLMGYFSRIQHSQAFSDPIDAFIAELKVFSSALCTERLFGLDASLWACALHYFETTLASSWDGNSALVARYKRQLMEGVDVAERRCFAEDVHSSPIVSFPIRSNRSKPKQRGRLSGHWEWEDMVGSWIRMTPVHKKRKVEGGHPHIPGHSHSHPRSTTSSKSKGISGSISPTTTSPRHRRLPTSSPSPATRLSEIDDSEYQNETDKENRFSSPPVLVKRLRPTKRRSSNFFSLLADAQANRIVLHPKPHPPSLAIPEKYVLPFSSHHLESRRTVLKQEQKPARPRTLLLSDDSLDLFTYATSSPARCRD